jgi:hypothetical protein
VSIVGTAVSLPHAGRRATPRSWSGRHLQVSVRRGNEPPARLGTIDIRDDGSARVVSVPDANLTPPSRSPIVLEISAASWVWPRRTVVLSGTAR